jgi:hypothetical protein
LVQFRLYVLWPVFKSNSKILVKFCPIFLNLYASIHGKPERLKKKLSNKKDSNIYSISSRLSREILENIWQIFFLIWLICESKMLSKKELNVENYCFKPFNLIILSLKFGKLLL